MLSFDSVTDLKREEITKLTWEEPESSRKNDKNQNAGMGVGNGLLANNFDLNRNSKDSLNQGNDLSDMVKA